MIDLKNITKQFGSLKAVDNISLSVGRGEVVGLLGPNGAGKTTTMRLITGYLSASKGDITIDGTPVSDNTSIKKNIGYLPEHTPLYHDIEVRETIDYFAKLRGISSREISKRRESVVEQCGLGDVIARPVGQISKGYRQRVGLALALIHEPSILILDEPTSGLDPNQIQEIRSLIKEIGKERTVVLSTHIMQEVEATCQRAFIIDHGKLVGEGTLAELKQHKTKGNVFEVSMRAKKDMIENSIHKLDGFSIMEWMGNDDSAVQRFMVSGPTGELVGEEIFNWAASLNMPISEMSRKSQSLEDVFRELTEGSSLRGTK